MRLLITAGPTREPIDAVRFIGNRSSGRFGLALARAALERGHGVTLLLGPGPGSAAIPAEAGVARFETTAQLERLLAERFPDCDRLLMAAAVADRRPASPSQGKLARAGGGLDRIELERTPDLVAQCAAARRVDQRIVAFSLEPPDELEARAARKLAAKGVDAVWANPLAVMEAESAEGFWITAAGERVRREPTDKAACARWLIERVEAL